MKGVIPVILVSFLLNMASCKEKNSSAEMIAQLNTSDTFRFEFPRRNWTWTSDSALYWDDLMHDKALGLDSLEKGFDSIQIRISYVSPMSNERIVMIRNRKGHWDAEISKVNVEIKPGFEDSARYPVWKYNLLTRTIERKIPKSGWNRFIRELFQLGILILPDEQNIKDFKYKGYTDGGEVLVKIATKNVYRVYGLSDPDMYMEYSEMKIISRILNLIDEEFSLEKLWNYTDKKINQDILNIPDTGNFFPQDGTDTPKTIRMKELILQDIKPEKKKKNK